MMVSNCMYFIICVCVCIFKCVDQMSLNWSMLTVSSTGDVEVVLLIRPKKQRAFVVGKDVTALLCHTGVSPFQRGLVLLTKSGRWVTFGREN